MKAGKRCQAGWSLLPLRAIRIQAGAVEGGITYILVYPFEYDRSVSNFELFFFTFNFLCAQNVDLQIGLSGFHCEPILPQCFLGQSVM